MRPGEMQGPYSADEGLVKIKELVISGGLTMFPNCLGSDCLGCWFRLSGTRMD